MAKIGGITDIKGGENNLEIINLSKFAVDEYNKKQNALLQFEYVVKAKQQIVEGVAYYIALVAKDGDVNNIYEAKVWDKIGKNSKELLEFKLVNVVGGITNDYIDSLARFAVDEYNKKQNAKLQFEEVTDSTDQEMSDGTSYDIKFEAVAPNGKKNCEAKVLVNKQNVKQLLEFKFLPPQHHK